MAGISTDSSDFKVVIQVLCGFNDRQTVFGVLWHKQDLRPGGAAFGKWKQLYDHH
jgi:hypothetical protein